MSIPEDKHRALIRYRIEQAKETAEEANLLIAHDKFRAAINRIYYAMFYMLLELGLKYRFETSKHGQLLGWFNKTFIKDGTIDRKYGKIVREAFEVRHQGDYDAYVVFSKEDVLNKYHEMNEFIATLEDFLLAE
jgi:uncharacterized protein (UPF0332 family)